MFDLGNSGVTHLLCKCPEQAAAELGGSRQQAAVCLPGEKETNSFKNGNEKDLFGNFS